MLMESLLKDLEDEDDQLDQIQETSTLSVIGEAISMSVDVDGNDSDDTGDEPLPCSSTPVHSRPEPQEVLKPMPRYPNSEHQGCSKCDRLAVTVENLQKQILDQNNNMYQLHLRLYQMEQYQYNSQSHNTQNQNGQSYISQTNNQTSNVQANEMQRMLVTPKSPSQLRSTERCEPVPTQVLYNGFTKAQLNHDLPGRGWKQDSKWLLRRMLTTEELKGHSITGHHGSKKKTHSVRPPLEDKSKLRVLYDIIIEKYPGRLVTDINLVLADVVKPSAPGMAE
ncbi:Hypothetical predicted protein [Mytilus galloprovincialis]|uniref:BEN domain-containing protein n=1 Tax=Mytilus galloprovincialis TaxID=29158 RepID=A0A8B6FA00_MYTGA|nr:Hypothetical predicted protein [Mytilus galloprovincialis]